MREGGIRRVFHLVDSLKLGGTEIQTVELARRMNGGPNQVTLGCLRAHGPLLDGLKGSKLRVEEFYPTGGVDSAAGVYQILRLYKFLRRERIDVVHTHDLWSNLLGVPAAWLARVPVIISGQRDLGHQPWYGKARRRWYRRVQNLAHVVVTNANSVREALITMDGFDPRKLKVIHNGIDVERFSRVAFERERLFPRWPKNQLIVQVGNMQTEVKGHHWLIAAAPGVIEKHPSARFVLVGEGRLRPELERQVAQLGLSEKFVFLGRRTDVPEILNSCDIAVLPSRSEGFPNALLEYMCAGLPSVASAVGGCTELIQHRVTGLLVPVGDAEALANALLELLSDTNFATQIGEAGQQYVRANFSFERLLREVDELYGELLARACASN